MVGGTMQKQRSPKQTNETQRDLFDLEKGEKFKIDIDGDGVEEAFKVVINRGKSIVVKDIQTGKKHKVKR